LRSADAPRNAENNEIAENAENNERVGDLGVPWPIRSWRRSAACLRSS
jgi:hypothetical protein